jgi:hypothetical protein
MNNYELRIRLEYLTLCGQNDKGELEWIGTNEQWTTVHSYLLERERVLKDLQRQKEHLKDIQEYPQKRQN